MKIYKKLLLSYLIVVLLPLLSVTYFLIEKITKETVNQSISINRIAYEQLRDNVNNLLTNYSNLCNSISTESLLLQYLSMDTPIDTDYGTKYSTFYNISSSLINKYALYTTQDVDITIYSKNKHILYDNIYFKEIDDSVIHEEWFRDTMTSTQYNSILSPYLDSSGKYKIPITRIINNDKSKDILDIVRIDIPESLLWGLIQAESKKKEIYILNSSDYILTSTSKELIGKHISSIKFNTDTTPTIMNIHPINIFIKPPNIVFNETFKTKIPVNQYRIITLIPSSVILGKTTELIKYGFIVSLISISVAIFFILIFSNKLASRLKLLVTSMSKVKDGNFDIYIHNEDSDEIGELSKSFKTMLDTINTLINEVFTNKLRVKDLEIAKKSVELHALQSQINPHFLFNTVESIRMHILKKGDLETSEVLESFGKLLRKSIEWKDHFIPLSQELELIEKYLKIQSFRYRGRFSFKINLSSELYSIIIPKFIIQPIIENAIYHGVEMKKGKGIIKVYGFKLNDTLKIIIQDNGVGMSEERLKQLVNSIQDFNNSDSSSSIGMKNANQRLKLLYGSSYGITITSKENKGTKVELLLPVSYEGSNNNV